MVDLGQIQIRDKTGSSNKSNTDSAGADEAAGEPRASKRPKKCMDHSDVDGYSLKIACEDPELQDFLKSEEYLYFRQEVIFDPCQYKHLRDVLEKTHSWFRKIITKYESQEDPLLEVLMQDNVRFHPFGNAVYKLLQSKEFRDFRDKVLQNPHDYKNLRSQFHKGEYYTREYCDEELGVVSPFHDLLLFEIIQYLADGGFRGGAWEYEKRLSTVEDSESFQGLVGKMTADDPEKSMFHVAGLLEKDPFVAILIYWDYDLLRDTKYEHLRICEKLSIAFSQANGMC